MLKVYFFEDKENRLTLNDLSAFCYSFIKTFCPKRPIISTTKNGKPYLKYATNFHFSIAHSKNAAAIAVSDKEVGVDIEKFRIFDKRVAERVLLSDLTDNMDLLKLWTKCEAAIKQKGLRLRDIKNIVVNTNINDIHTFEYREFVVSVYNGTKEEPVFSEIEEEEATKLLENTMLL